MKNLKPWSMLILIASVLLLSGAIAESTAGNKEHQNQTATTHERGASSKTKIATPAFTIVVQPAPVTVVQPSAPVEKKQPAQKWYQRPSATDWGILGVTLAYTLLSLGLLNATRKQAKLANEALTETKKATDAAQRQAAVSEQTLTHTRMSSVIQQITSKESVDVAKLSAEIAKLALNAERPFVLVEKQSMYFSAQPRSLSILSNFLDARQAVDITNNPLSHRDQFIGAGAHISFELRNMGKGVAIIENAAVHVLYGHGMLKDPSCRTKKIERIAVPPSYQHLLGSNESHTLWVPSFTVTLETLADIVGLKRGVLVLLLVRYRDVYRRTFVTVFPFQYEPRIWHDGQMIHPGLLTPRLHKRPRYF